MKRLVLLLVAVMFAVAMIGGEAFAKGSSGGGGGGGAKGGSFSSGSKSGSGSGGSKPSGASSKPAPPKYNPVSNPKPQTYKGKTYTPPPATSKFKSTPYYGTPGYGNSYNSVSNFWMWAFIFHGTGHNYDDCDRSDYQSGDDDCEYAYEYGGDSNNSGYGWFLAICLLIGGTIAAIVLWPTKRY